jgi:hypothetical protein
VLRTEIVRGMLVLTIPYFFHSTHCKVSECSHTVCTKAVTAYTLFAKFNSECKVHRITNKVVHFRRGAQVKCVRKPRRAADNLCGRRIAYHRARCVCIFKWISYTWTFSTLEPICVGSYLWLVSLLSFGMSTVHHLVRSGSTGEVLRIGSGA